MHTLLIDLIAAGSLAVLVALLWIVGATIVPSAPSSEQLAAGLLAALAVAWLVVVSGSAGFSLLGSRYAHVAGLAAVVMAVAYRRPPLRLPHPDWLPLLAGVVSGFIISFPGWWAPSSPPFGDMALHDGWIRQIVGGMAAPGHPYAHVPNSYPWLYHALGGLFDTAFPGGLAVTMLLLQAFVVLALGLGSWLIARELGLPPDAAVWAVVLTVAGGGLAVSDAPEPIASLGNVPPPLPRELGLSIFTLQLWLLIRAANRQSRLPAAAAGAAAGLAFIAAPIAGIVAMIVTALMLVRRPALVVAATATAASAILPWVLPLAEHYHRLHGFRTITAIHEDPSLARLVGAVGLICVLGAVGLVMLHRRAGGAAALILPAAVAGLFVLLAAVSGSRWQPLQIPAFGRPVRYTPELALTLSIAAGMPVSALMRRRPAVAAAVVLLCVALPVTSSLRTGTANAARPSFDAQCLLNHEIRPGHTVAILGLPGHTMTGLALFSATGASPLFIRRPRIRFVAIYETITTQAERQRWQADIALGGRWPAPVTDVLLPLPTTIRIWSGARVLGDCLVGEQRYAVYHRTTD